MDGGNFSHTLGEGVQWMIMVQEADSVQHTCSDLPSFLTFKEEGKQTLTLQFQK